MKAAQVRRAALALPEASEAPHFESASFRIRGKIFATLPPDGEYVHIFVADLEREIALASYPECVAKLFWGGRVVGIRVELASAPPAAVKKLLAQAWARKAPKALQADGS